jgi:hypothetical protein
MWEGRRPGLPRWGREMWRRRKRRKGVWWWRKRRGVMQRPEKSARIASKTVQGLDVEVGLGGFQIEPARVGRVRFHAATEYFRDMKTCLTCLKVPVMSSPSSTRRPTNHGASNRWVSPRLRTSTIYPHSYSTETKYRRRMDKDGVYATRFTPPQSRLILRVFGRAFSYGWPCELQNAGPAS